MKHQIFFHLKTLLLLLVCGGNVLAGKEENIALGKSYQMDPPPRYALCTSDRDVVKLTDGILTPPARQPIIWTSKETTVGWQWTMPIITIDLRKSHTIEGVTFSTAAGRGGVTWPRQIAVFSSEDGNAWRFLGDAAQISNREIGQPPEKEAVWTFQARNLNGHGRYVAIAVEATPSDTNAHFVFCDEIEIFGGEEKEPGRGTHPSTLVSGNEGMRNFLKDRQALIGMQNRMRMDADQIDEAGKRSKDSEEILDKSHIAKEIAQIAAPDHADFKTLLPFPGLHAGIWAKYGKLLSAHLPPISLWKQHRYERLPYLTDPAVIQKSGPAAISIGMMKGEFRSDALNITNASEEEVDLSMTISDLPDDLKAPGWLRVSEVQWTDTAHGEPVAAALTDLLPQKGAYTLRIPAGMTRKIWLTVDSKDIDSGDYKLAVDFQRENFSQSIPFHLHVSKIAMWRPRLSLGGWDYTDGIGGLAITPENLESSIRFLQSYFVDSPAARKRVLPWPEKEDFDSADRLIRPLDFHAFDEWMRRWPDARFYSVFIDGQEQFAGARRGSAGFRRRLQAWVTALAKHLAEIGVDSNRLVLQIVDEPRTDAQDERFLQWAEAIKSANTGILIYTNPTWLRPDQKKNQEAVQIADILSPYIIKYKEGGPKVSAYFENHRRNGKILWSYLCAGPTRTYDPTKYYRSHAWWAFAHGGSSIWFWAFGDTGKGSSWNEYVLSSPHYAPAFLSRKEMTSSVPMEAIREGVEDFEYLSMLKDAVAGAPDGPWKTEASLLLEEGPERVLKDAPDSAQWQEGPHAAEPDHWRAKILGLLESQKPQK